MKNKIFLSPSNQRANVGAYRNTNECEQCTAIASAAAEHLIENYVCEVEIGREEDNMSKRATISELFGSGAYVAIHTNAFSDAAVSGTETYFHSSDEKGKELASMLLENVSKLTGRKRSCKKNDSLIELNTPTCARAYIEVEFHSNPDKALWIENNTDEIGKVIAETIADFMELETKSEEGCSPSDAALPPTTDIERDKKWVLEHTELIFRTLEEAISEPVGEKKYYRVQTGAYSTKKSAETMQAKLKGLGISSIIRYY